LGGANKQKEAVMPVGIEKDKIKRAMQIIENEADLIESACTKPDGAWEDDYQDAQRDVEEMREISDYLNDLINSVKIATTPEVVALLNSTTTPTPYEK
jgi:hypothetical protein